MRSGAFILRYSGRLWGIISKRAMQSVFILGKSWGLLEKYIERVRVGQLSKGPDRQKYNSRVF